jgi:hypothetical protein
MKRTRCYMLSAMNRVHSADSGNIRPLEDVLCRKYRETATEFNKQEG